MGAAFASARLLSEAIVFGNKKVAIGTFTPSGGSTGGDIDTGLNVVEMLLLTHSGASAVASSPSVNETYPAAGSAMTIVTTADSAGYWLAIGY